MVSLFVRWHENRTWKVDDLPIYFHGFWIISFFVGLWAPCSGSGGASRVRAEEKLGEIDEDSDLLGLSSSLIEMWFGIVMAAILLPPYINNCTAAYIRHVIDSRCRTKQCRRTKNTPLLWCHYIQYHTATALLPLFARDFTALREPSFAFFLRGCASFNRTIVCISMPLPPHLCYQSQSPMCLLAAERTQKEPQQLHFRDEKSVRFFCWDGMGASAASSTNRTHWSCPARFHRLFWTRKPLHPSLQSTRNAMW